MKQLLFIAISSIFISFACTSGAENKVSELEDEVLTIHDEVMPKMEDINRLEIQISELLPYKSGQYDSIIVAEIESVLSMLETAGESMMEWMRQYKSPEDSDDDSSAIAYLNIQKTMIEKVRANMLSSVAKADSLLMILNNKSGE